MSKITHDEVKALFNYNRETGMFYRYIGIPGASKGVVRGCMRPDGYIYIGVNKKRELAHRLVWLWVHGYLPEQIDHIDGDKTNNRISNLREATTSQNHGNTSINSKNTSGFKGVRKRGSRWHASIKHLGKFYHLGTFGTPEEAHSAYIAAAKNHFGSFHNAG